MGLFLWSASMLDTGPGIFLLGLSRGQNGIDNRFGVKLVWKELPQHFDGCPAELQAMDGDIKSPYATLMPPLPA